MMNYQRIKTRSIAFIRCIHCIIYYSACRDTDFIDRLYKNYLMKPASAFGRKNNMNRKIKIQN